MGREARRGREWVWIRRISIHTAGWTVCLEPDHEFYGLYKNKRDKSFEDVASREGIARASQMMSGWGLRFFDYDNAGNLDMFIANGHPDDLVHKIGPGVTYSEPLLLFKNTGGGFKNVSGESGPLFARSLSARGLATAISTTMARWTC